MHPIDPKPVSQSTRSALEKQLKARVDGEVRFDTATIAMYTTDGSNYRQVPLGVVIPKSIDSVVSTVSACSQFDVPVLSRGGGTALAGQSCNEAVMIDFSKNLTGVICLKRCTALN